MSAISKVRRRLDELDMILGKQKNALNAVNISNESLEYQEQNQTLINSNTILKNILQELRLNILQDINRLVSKVDQKDVITGEDRFGANAKGKILELPKLREVCEQRCLELLDLQNNFELVKSEHLSLKIGNQTVNSIDITDLDHNTGNVILPKDESEDKTDYEEINRKANEIRERKILQEKLKREGIEMLKKRMKEYILEINKFEKGLSAFTHSIELIKSPSTSKTNDVVSPGTTTTTIPTNLHSVFSILLSITENIISHPENVSFRTLRLNNLKLKNDLFSANGVLPALIAMGFVAVAVVPTNTSQLLPDNSTSNSNSSSGSSSITSTTTISSMSSLDDAPSHVTSSVSLPLLPVTTVVDGSESREIVLIMDEPNPEKDGTTVWIEWFDLLSGAKDLLLLELKRCR